MTSQPGKQTIAIHILPNISRNKDNQAMKFGQLLEYNMRSIFFENSCKDFMETKGGLELVFLSHFLHGF